MILVASLLAGMFVTAGPVSADPTSCGYSTMTTSYSVVTLPVGTNLGGGRIINKARFCFNGNSVWAYDTNQPQAIYGAMSLYKPGVFSRAVASVSNPPRRVFAIQWRWVFQGSVFGALCWVDFVQVITVDRDGRAKMSSTKTYTDTVGNPWCTNVAVNTSNSLS